ncbi:hypothetical protein SK355_09555 [Candidatus Fukatsuia symbiotica]|nr:hypothetical protein [Candidatus Fukatsuia symbiotica]MEA9445463.1 hypothetical protein [Candidatus Fukatsuia symbiotica]
MKLLRLVLIASLALTSLGLSAKVVVNDNKIDNQLYDSSDRKRCGYLRCE